MVIKNLLWCVTAAINVSTVKLRTTRWQQGDIFDIIYNLKWTTNDNVSLIKMRVKQHRSFIYQWQVRGESMIYNYISDLDALSGCCFFCLFLWVIFQIALSILSFINFIFSVLYDINRLMTPKMPLLHRRWRCGHKTPLLSVKQNPRRRKTTSHETKTEIMLLEIET